MPKEDPIFLIFHILFLVASQSTKSQFQDLHAVDGEIQNNLFHLMRKKRKKIEERGEKEPTKEKKRFEKER